MYNATACDPTVTTCCPYFWAPTGWGCCPFPNAVCCANTYTCCPFGTRCQDHGEDYNTQTDCIAEEKVVQSGLQICKLGPPLPPDTTLPSCLVLGMLLRSGCVVGRHTQTTVLALRDLESPPRGPIFPIFFASRESGE